MQNSLKQENNTATDIYPANVDAEAALLGEILADTKNAGKNMAQLIGMKLSAADFYRPAYGLIYNAMFLMYEKNIPIDMITLPDFMEKLGTLNDAGGRTVGVTLAAAPCGAWNIVHHAEIIKEKAFYRRLMEASRTIAGVCSAPPDTLAEAKALAEKAIGDAMGGDVREGAAWGELLLRANNRLSDALHGRQTNKTINTGFVDYDRFTGGLRRGDLILVAARPSMGKTAFALNIAANVAFRGQRQDGQKKAVYIASLEMSADDLTDRLVSSEAKINLREIGPTEQKTEEEKEAVIQKALAAYEAIYEADLRIDDDGAATLAGIKAGVRRWKSEKGRLDLVVVDYIGLIVPAPGAPTRENEISTISRGFKALAMELDVPIILLVQLNRSVEARQIKRPMLSDLRESGALEQDADVVIFLYREDYYKGVDEPPTHITDVIVAKNRKGPTGTISLYWNEEYTLFCNLLKRPLDEPPQKKEAPKS